jgi:hypothetical protein
MKDSKALRVIAGVTALGAAAALYFSSRALPPSVDATLPKATGWVLAQEALARLKPDGRLIVITRDTAAFPHPESDYQFRTFQKAMREAKVTMDSVQRLQLDPLRPIEVPPGDFFELIRNAPAGSVIVSFLGPPLLTEDQRARLKVVRPQVLAFCPGALPAQVDLRILFDAQLLQLAVISRGGQPRAAAKPKDLRGWFDTRYRIVTATDVANLYTMAR